MATSSGGGDKHLNTEPQPEPTPTTQNQNLQPLDSSPNPATPPIPITDSKQPTTPATVNSRPREPDSDVIRIPSYSRWFSWNNIDECEVRVLPEFFDGRSASKSPKVYKYYRNAIVKKFRDGMKCNENNSMPKLTFTEARKSIIGDVGSIRKVFDFLEAWGLINYFGSPITKAQLKWEDKESSRNVSQQTTDPNSAAAGDAILPKKRVCNSCNSLCTIACFSNIKKDLTFCARCYVRGGPNSSDFRRVEISEEVKTDWSEKETLHLLEAVMHYGDDWKKVSEHVVGRSEKECVDRFIKLPFGDQFIDSTPTKKMRLTLTPLDDASNPIMAQAAFLSALVGVEVAETTASATVKALSQLLGGAADEDSLTKNGNSLEQGYLDKEEQDFDRTISDIAQVQAKDIHDKIVGFEELELQMEREWQQVGQIQNQLFADKLTLLFHKV